MHASKIKKDITRALDLPADSIMDLPRICYDGAGDLFIENHKGIVEYNAHCLRLMLHSGMLRISGTDLTINDMGANAVKVSGGIRTLEFL